MSKASEYAKRSSDGPFCNLAWDVALEVLPGTANLSLQMDDNRVIVAADDIPALIKWLRETYED